MAKLVIDSETLQGLANALRSVTGETRTYTPTEMIEAVTNIMETGTYILVDEDGNEVPAVFVDNEQVFTATANDIRIGTTAVTEAGVTEGTKEIPAYIVLEGYRLITTGSKFSIATYNDCYDFTKLQCIICPIKTTVDDSVAAEKVTIGEHTYNVNSTDVVGDVTRDAANQMIDLGITNNSGKLYLLRFFTYKEVY